MPALNYAHEKQLVAARLARKAAMMPKTPPVQVIPCARCSVRSDVHHLHGCSRFTGAALAP